jgi:L-asparaginase/Glu-tRNA(Gln) amidotransferase subunit D
VGASLLAPPPASAQDELPIVKIFAPGGTIANTPDGRIAVEAVIDALRVEAVTRTGSSSLSWQEFLDTAKAIERTVAAEPEVDAARVTIGSNSSDDMAGFLDLVIDSEKPIVVTAAQRRRTTRSEDASRNFIDALITAGTPEAAGEGALLVADELIHPARAVTKHIVGRVETRQSLDTGALGMIGNGEAIFYRSPTRRHTTDSEFDLDGIETADDPPTVEILYSYVDAGPALVEAALEHAGADGLVVAAFSTGSARVGQRPRLEAAAEAGTPVVLSNRSGSGRIAGRGAPYLDGDTLTPQKAHTLSTTALTVTDDHAEIQRIFDAYRARARPWHVADGRGRAGLHAADIEVPISGSPASSRSPTASGWRHGSPSRGTENRPYVPNTASW